jgi:anti-sigma B factor antagonist
MTQRALDVAVTRQAGTVTLRVAGEVDLATSPLLAEHAERVLPDVKHCLVLDFSDVDFLDSTGLSALVRLRRAADRAGVRFAVVNLAGHVDNVVRICGMVDLLGSRNANAAA